MGEMVRKQIYLEKRQVSAIHKRAATLGINESEVIRQAIDHDLYGSGAMPTQADPSAWDEIEAFLDSQANLPLAGEAYEFNRDQLYEDRIRRINEPDID